MGFNTLTGYKHTISCLMKAVVYKGQTTNHSLKVSTATRLQTDNGKNYSFISFICECSPYVAMQKLFFDYSKLLPLNSHEMVKSPY